MARGFRGLRREPSSGKKMCDVLYWVDVNVGYHENVRVGDSVLNPTSFTPTKSGYTFLGWKDSGIASADVFTDKTAEGASMVLFAVFTKTITVTYRNYTVTSTATGTQYYNNSDTLNPSFTLTQTPISAWIARGWTTSASGGASTITYANGATFTRDSDITLYGCYYRTVTVSYNGNGATSGSTAASTGTAYYHSASGGTNAAITIRANGFARTNYGFRYWRLNSTSGTVYSAGSTYTSVGDATMYAEWYATTVTFNYSASRQSFTAPVAGQYFIKCYGAQGSSPSITSADGARRASATGGYGGYAQGYVTLTAGQTIYIYCGYGSNHGGANSRNIPSGGGGYADKQYVGAGGYYTGVHSGSAWYIIAGGGGGGACGTNYDGAGSKPGGTGGGSSGGAGQKDGWDTAYGTEYIKSQATGGTQTSNGANAVPANTSGAVYGGAGGGYHIGGNGVLSSNRGYACASGGGGSGYIGGVTSGSMSNGQKSGAGQVIITKT